VFVGDPWDVEAIAQGAHCFTILSGEDDPAMSHAHSEHEHGHEHTHRHRHGTLSGAALTKAFGIGLILNFAFVVIESAAGVFADSTALLADAAHNLSDVLGLLLAWGATRLAAQRPTLQRTYGLRRSTILAALANALLVLVVLGGVVWEAVGRLRVPPAVDGWIVIGVAGAGVAVNGLSAAVLARGRAQDANVRMAYLHLAADAAVSLGVVVSGVVLTFTGWWWLDPATSLAVSLAVMVGTWGLLREAIDLSLDAVPRKIDAEAVLSFLGGQPGVRHVHDLHIWSMSTTEVALTAHLVMPWSECPPEFLRRLEHDLRARFGIHHATVQIEPEGLADPCSLSRSDHVHAGGR
jgi:cobalt-zinc-cadmium efflux system protein